MPRSRIEAALHRNTEAFRQQRLLRRRETGLTTPRHSVSPDAPRKREIHSSLREIASSLDEMIAPFDWESATQQAQQEQEQQLQQYEQQQRRIPAQPPHPVACHV